jgi:DNA polymerase (family X)
MTTPRSNAEFAELLRDIAAAYQLKDENKNKFRITAYNRAADSIEHLGTELKDIWQEGKLDDIAGVGESMAKNLSEIFEKGKSKEFENLLSEIPPAVFELMKVPGIGPKKAYKLSNHFKLKKETAIVDLIKIAQEDKISSLESFGKESQADILTSLTSYKPNSKRMLLPDAQELADQIIAWMKKDKNVIKIEPLGSLRRKAPTVGDIDVAVATNKPKVTLDHFAKYPHLSRVIKEGDKSASITLPTGVNVDIIAIAPDSFGSLLQHFTGSKHHNVALREYSLKKGLSLSEKGIKNIKSGKMNKFESEEKFYNFLGLDWIAPELREESGEIKSSLNKKLPDLIELKDIRADLQIHSNYDIETSHDVGASSMQEVVNMASSLNYEYIAFTEHNPSQSKHNDKQIVQILQHKKQHVDKLNTLVKHDMKTKVQKVFNSLEIDILPSGNLPVPHEGLETLDFALVSIHSSFKLDKQKMTQRVLSALSHPKVKIFAHPTARLINKRESVDLDWDKIFTFCLENNKWIEINADPHRLDLPDYLVRDAVKKGVKLTMGTDAHHRDGLLNMKWGIANARRGWATKHDIINTLSLKKFESLL